MLMFVRLDSGTCLTNNRAKTFQYKKEVIPYMWDDGTRSIRSIAQLLTWHSTCLLTCWETMFKAGNTHTLNCTVSALLFYWALQNSTKLKFRKYDNLWLTENTISDQRVDKILSSPISTKLCSTSYLLVESRNATKQLFWCANSTRG